MLLRSLVAAGVLVWCTAATFPAAAEVYDLSKLPESPNWKQISWEERKAAATIPAPILKNIDTADLVETCLRHPFRVLFLAADVMDRGMDSVISASSCFEELLARPDAGEELVAKYLSIDPAPCATGTDHMEQARFNIDMCFLELMLARPTVIASLSEGDRSRLLRHGSLAYGARRGCGVGSQESISLLLARGFSKEDATYSDDLGPEGAEEFSKFLRGEVGYSTRWDVVIDRILARVLAIER